MEKFDPIKNVADSDLILDNGMWPNFHDAEIHDLHFWRGDVRPDQRVWIGTVIVASFELCALEKPYIAVLKFHDCESIRLKDFNHQNAIYCLNFEFEARGNGVDGMPLPPWIAINFEQAFGAAFSFKCMRVQAIERKKITNPDRI